MWTVTLKLWPQVVTAHLLGGFTTMSLIWLWSQRLGGWQWRDVQVPSQIKLLAVVALVMVIVQISLGGWTSSNYAAMACTDFPKCHDSWWPQADFAQGFNFLQKVGPNYLGGLLDNHARTAIHFAHRIGAVLVTLVTGALIALLWCTGFAQVRRMALLIAGLLSVQLILGISNILWVIPLPVAVAHNAFGAVLLLSLVTLNHRLRFCRSVGND